MSPSVCRPCVAWYPGRAQFVHNSYTNPSTYCTQASPVVHLQSERMLGVSTKFAVAIPEDRLQEGLGLRQEAPMEAPGWEEHALGCQLVSSTGRGLKG